MKLIQIDEEKCKKDNICIIECPFNLLRENESGIPEMIEGGETNCMVCGHCLAICPSGAVSLNGISPDSCDASQKNIIVDPQTMEALLKNRRSVRVYKDKSIERDTVGHLMDMIRWVPSSKNTQPLHWKLVDDRAKIREMAGLTVQWFEETNAFPDIVAAWKGGEDMILRNAPLIAIAHVAKNALNPTTDACIATASLELAAMSYGIGSFWTGFFMRAANNYTPLKAFLKLPENHAVFAGLALGYPKFKYHKIPNRQASKVTWM
jgi:nitroreductase/NAD-dependent dihydropyrimidine dehydrogenase PreA subunit